MPIRSCGKPLQLASMVTRLSASGISGRPVAESTFGCTGFPSMEKDHAGNQKSGALTGSLHVGVRTLDDPYLVMTLISHLSACDSQILAVR